MFIYDGLFDFFNSRKLLDGKIFIFECYGDKSYVLCY